MSDCEKIKVISFDVDGTLVDYGFINSIWFERIPKLYAEEKGVSFEKAESYVKRQYDRVGEQRLEWYDIEYWFRIFALRGSWRDVIRDCRSEIRVYSEVREVLENLRDFKLIVISNSPRAFLDVELEEGQIGGYFQRTFSSVSDFGQTKKKGELYLKICKFLDISPQEMVHVGDDRNFDFNTPKEVNIVAFYLDRSRRCSGNFVIHDLSEFEDALKRIAVPDKSTNNE